MKLRNHLGEFRVTPRKVISRVQRTLASFWCYARFGLTALVSRAAITDAEAETIVSVTSYGSRLKRVHLAIESIARGAMRPQKVILWVDPEDWPYASEQRAIRRLVERGLELRQGEKRFRAHNKYFNYAVGGDVGYLVTADDDIFYPKYWLEDLWHSFNDGRREQVAAHWVRRPLMVGGVIAPMHQWSNASDRVGRVGSFSAGVAGVIFPNQLRTALAEEGTAFLDTSPLADDVWISWCALRTGTPVRQCRNRSLVALVVPFTQKIQLAHENTLNGQNDRQILATYSKEDRRKLEAVGGS